MDNDKLLPHNLARNALTMDFIGQHKAHSLCRMINNLVQDELTTSLNVDILRPGDKESDLAAVLNNSVAVVVPPTSCGARRPSGRSSISASATI